MKQVYQLLKTGKLAIEDVPTPALISGTILVRVEASLISAGTERAMVDFAQKSLLAKARSRPDLVRLVIDKARREGIATATSAALQKLDRPQALGYSCAGTVIGVADDVASYRVGDRVACSGTGYANHAGVVAVPANLVAAIPNLRVSFEDAAFTTVGAIAMHGLRLADIRFGETVAVIGLGLVGIIAVQLAKAAGCTVVGVDPNEWRCSLAARLGCKASATNEDEFQALVASHTHGLGADAVVITAATESNSPVELAGRVARNRGKVVAVGQVGTTLPRKTYYEKELEFAVSKSYGPGRYDPNYEEKGHDYPVAYVRWTENRNMQAFLSFLADGSVELKPLISHRFSVEDAAAAYELISDATSEPFLGVILAHPESVNGEQRAITLRTDAPKITRKRVRAGMLGAGNFATSVLLPAIVSSGMYELIGLCTSAGATARTSGEKFHFQYCTTENARVIDDAAIDAIIIATRHNSHAAQITAALRSGKSVFCEKPLCLNIDELIGIAEVYSQTRTGNAPQLMVGFNRRFAPLACRLREFFAGTHEPLVVACRVNGGYVPADNWVQDPTIGGGRIVGELCHFIDLATFLVDSSIVRVFATGTPDRGRYCRDNIVVSLAFANGSAASITYVANGDKGSGKERIEVFGGGLTGVLDEFRTLELTRGGRRRTIRDHLRQDKGHKAEIRAFAESLKNGTPAIPIEQIYASTLAAFAVQHSLAAGLPVEVTVGPLLGANVAAPTTVASSGNALKAH